MSSAPSLVTFEMRPIDDAPPPIHLGCLGSAPIHVDCRLPDRVDIDHARRGAFYVVQLIRACGGARVEALPGAREGGVRITAPADRFPATLIETLDALECEPPAQIHVPAALADAFAAANAAAITRMPVSTGAALTTNEASRIIAAIRGLRAAATTEPAEPDTADDTADDTDERGWTAEDRADAAQDEAADRALDAAAAEIGAALADLLERAGVSAPHATRHRHHDITPLAGAALLIAAAAAPTERAAQSAVDTVFEQ